MKDIRARNRLNVSLHLVLPAGGEPGSGAGPRPAGPAGGSVGRRGRAPVGPPVGGGSRTLHSVYGHPVTCLDASDSQVAFGVKRSGWAMHDGGNKVE